MDDTGLIFAMDIDGNGGARKLSWSEALTSMDGPGITWVHLDFLGSGTLGWLREHSRLGRDLTLAVTAEDTRPRLLQTEDTALIILRGVNLNPGADADDMVSVRVVIEGRRIITLRHRKVLSIEDIRLALLAGNGPRNCGEFVAELASRLTTRMSETVEREVDRIDALEEMVAQTPGRQLRAAISESRHTLIALRRYILPQREVMSQVLATRFSWLDDYSRAVLREAADQATRMAEDLDAARDRAAVVRDELESRMAEQMNRTMYVLSVVAAIFLPLSLLTGLLGINVMGIPGAQNPSAFYIVCAGLLLIAALQIWLFKRMHWI